MHPPSANLGRNGVWRRWPEVPLVQVGSIDWNRAERLPWHPHRVKSARLITIQAQEAQDPLGALALSGYEQSAAGHTRVTTCLTRCCA